MKEKSLKVNSIVNLLKTVLGLIFPLITFPYASRILGVDNIGRVNFANSTINYFVLIAGLGIGNYATREGARIRDDSKAINKFCTEILLINIFSTLVAYIGVFILVQIPAFQPYKSLLLLFSLTIFFNVIGISWLFNIYEEFVYITIRTVFCQIVSLILLLLLVRDSRDLLLYAAILVFSSVGANVFNIFYSRKFVRFFPKEKYELGPHLKPIFILFGMSIASTIYLNMDTTMIGLMQGDHAVGLYTAASKLNRIACNVIASVCIVFLPRLSYYLKTDRKKDFQKLVNSAFYYILGITIPVSVGLFVLSHEAILIFSGKEFLEAVPTFIVKAPNIILSVINGFIAVQLFVPLGKEKESLCATITGAVINCMLNYFLIPVWGGVGAAIATICAESCVLIICIRYLKPVYPLGNIGKETGKYTIGSCSILVVGHLIHQFNLNIWSTILLIVPLSVVSYFVILWYLKSEMITQLLETFLKGRKE